MAKSKLITVNSIETADLIVPLETPEENFSALVNNMKDEVHHWKVVYDENGEIETWILIDANPAALKSWGKELSDIKGKRTEEIFTQSDPVKLFKPIVQKIFQDGKPYLWTEYFPDTSQYLQMTTIPLTDGSFFSTGSDISDRIENENKLIKEKEKADAATNAKSEFLANMSHELRTPMNGLLGFTQLLLHTDLDNEQKDYVQNIIKCGNSFMDIISDLLDAACCEGKQLKIHKVNFSLNEVIETLYNLFKPQSEMADIKLCFNISENISDRIFNSDPLRIKQIIFNLLGNAFKFTQNGSVTLNIDYIDKDEIGDLKIEVKDTGIGIGTNNLADIYDPFYKEYNCKSSMYEGSGLGLYIVKNLVHLMNGTIKTKSTKDKGSKFIVYIPVKSINNNL